ncbi:hypothetical protein AB1Y20_003390 [Prymnesium parvum]|uniref:Centrosomal protein of 19 kDa n=1 Tax=Prymnesium parvum TaxID=97485 RepID=A0AB34JEF3_PRYPA
MAAAITRHRIGVQRSPPALVLFYSREGREGLRKRVMPVRSLDELGVHACAKLLVEAHREYLDEKAVDFEQVKALCEQLASSKPSSSSSSPPTRSEAVAEAPRALDRSLLRQMEVDFNSSGSDQEAHASDADKPPAAAASLPTARSRAGGLPPPSAIPRASGAAKDAVSQSPSKGASKGAKAGQSEAKDSPKKEAKEKKGGKKAKKAKKNGSAANGDDGWAGPSLNSLLGLSSDDEGASPTKVQPPKSKPAPAMSSLKDMPPLF